MKSDAAVTGAMPWVGGSIVFFLVGRRAVDWAIEKTIHPEPSRISGLGEEAVVIAIAIGVFALVHARTSRPTKRPRMATVAALSLLGWLPTMALGAREMLSRPLFYDHIAAVPKGELEAVADIFAQMILCLLAALVGGAVFANLARQRVFDRFLRPLTVGVVSVAGVCLVLAGLRDRPDADVWEDTLKEAPIDLTGAPADAFGAPVFQRACREHPVLAPMDRPGAAPKCAGVRLAKDPEGDPDVVLVEVATLTFDQNFGGYAAYGAYRTSTLKDVPAFPRELGVRLGPPIGWVGTGAFGAVVAIALLLVARRARREAPMFDATLQEAHHTGEGWLRFVDSAPVHWPQAADLPIGPVILVVEQKLDPTYRTAGAPQGKLVMAGTIAEIRSDVADRASGLEAAAFTTALLTATPLVYATAKIIHDMF